MAAGRCHETVMGRHGLISGSMNHAPATESVAFDGEVCEVAAARPSGRLMMEFLISYCDPHPTLCVPFCIPK